MSNRFNNDGIVIATYDEHGKQPPIEPQAAELLADDDHADDEPTRTELIQTARDMYQNDDVEIDDNAKLSRNDEDGSWVAAWVWVRYEEVKGYEERGE